MSKALCIKKSDLIKDNKKHINLLSFSNPDVIFSLPKYLVERSVCETDESYLQIIPYVTLIKEVGDDDHIFVYQRGKGSGEDRLKNKFSIGLGGHIDTHPESYNCFFEHIAKEAERELVEEVGLSYGKYYKKLYDCLKNCNFALLYLNNEPVNKYHICLSIIIQIDENEIFDLEKDIIINSKWLQVNELIDSKRYGSHEYEEWTELIIDVMTEMYSRD